MSFGTSSISLGMSLVRPWDFTPPSLPSSVKCRSRLSRYMIAFRHGSELCQNFGCMKSENATVDEMAIHALAQQSPRLEAAEGCCGSSCNSASLTEKGSRRTETTCTCSRLVIVERFTLISCFPSGPWRVDRVWGGVEDHVVQCVLLASVFALQAMFDVDSVGVVGGDRDLRSLNSIKV